MDLNRGHYKTEDNYNLHKKAWGQLLEAIEHEEKGDMVKARYKLILACRDELLALGFESNTKLMSSTVKPWDKKPTIH